LKVTTLTIRFDRERRVPGQVYDLLHAKLLLGDFDENEPLNERRLSEWLGVSRTPIREALRKLNDEGLIEIIPHVGCKVVPIDQTRVRELCQIRTELECLAVRSAAANFTETAGAQLESLIAEQAQTVVLGDLVRNIAVDGQFHRALATLSGMQTLGEFTDRVMGGILRARHLSIRIPGRLHEPIEEHRQILAALRTQDPEASSLAMRNHLELSYRSIAQALAAAQIAAVSAKAETPAVSPA
jgi:GntR family transcriptional regulator, rspAB operon transcriptional repressor